MKDINSKINEIAGVCADCGNCLSACPIYDIELQEPVSPRGKINLIKAILENSLKPNNLNKKFIYQCLLCGSCSHICTQGLDFIDMMISYRNLISKGKHISAWKKIVLFIYQSVVIKKAGWIFSILNKTPLKKKLTIPQVKNTNLKSLYTRDDLKNYDIILFPGCVLNYFYSFLIPLIIRFFRKKGFSVALPPQLECCGFPYISQGWEKKFSRLVKRNRAIFSRYKYKYLIVPCGTGVTTLKSFYEVNNDSIFELSEFIYNFCSDSKINTSLFGKDTQKVTFHDPCHNLKTLDINKQPRFFLKQLGDRYIDDASALCCGFGGIFSVGFPKLSKKILARRNKFWQEKGVDTVVTSCPGCYLQLRENLPLDIKFFIELFDF